MMNSRYSKIFQRLHFHLSLAPEKEYLCVGLQELLDIHKTLITVYYGTLSLNFVSLQIS